MNTLYASPEEAFYNKRLEAGKIYIIDFHTSQQLGFGPGRQPPIVLPDSQLKKPLDVKVFDPYSFDVHCTGKTMEFLLEVRTRACS